MRGNRWQITEDRWLLQITDKRKPKMDERWQNRYAITGNRWYMVNQDQDVRKWARSATDSWQMKDDI